MRKTYSKTCAALFGALLLSGYTTEAASPANPCKDGRGTDAINACTSLINSGRLTGTDLAAAYYNRGDSYGTLFQFDQAIGDYNMAIALAPSRAGYLTSRAEAYITLAQYDRAIADYDKAIPLEWSQHNEFDFTGQYVMARAETYERLSQYDRAAEDYDKAAVYWPDASSDLAAMRNAARQRSAQGTRANIAFLDCYFRDDPAPSEGGSTQILYRMGHSAIIDFNKIDKEVIKRLEKYTDDRQWNGPCRAHSRNHYGRRRQCKLVHAGRKRSRE